MLYEKLMSIMKKQTTSADVSSIPDVFVSCHGFNDNKKKKLVVRPEKNAVENLIRNLFQVLSL